MELITILCLDINILMLYVVFPTILLSPQVITVLEANFCFILRLNTKLIALELLVKIQTRLPELVGEWPASGCQ